ncbi:MAG: helix-turn-helix domain-containing protein [Candidatus Omnitrophota bacterium]|nr:helix-turn-helix domain-containing protein [Candidatus Omnitrophota bacterium]
MSCVMTVPEVATYLKMKTVTIYKHAQGGKIPAFKVGSKWRFKKETIDKWIEKQEKRL